MPEDLPLPATNLDDSRRELRSAVLHLALPALGEQVLNFCVGLFDTFLAGQVAVPGIEVGVSTSAVGLAMYLSWLGTLLFAMVGTGITVLVARSWGAGDRAAANRFANCGVTLAGVAGVVVFSLLYFLAPWYARVQDLKGESFQIVVNFLRADAVGELFYCFCLVGASALRGVGDMRSTMVILSVVNLLNMGASTLLVYGVGPIPSFGIYGIAYGTVFAKSAGGLIMLAILASGAKDLKLQRALLRPMLDDVRRILRIGIPAAMDGIAVWIGQSFFLMIVSRLGAEGEGQANLAAHIIGIQIEALTYLPATAWGYATATILGQSLGAGNVERARRVAHEAGRQCGWIALLATLFYLVGAQWIMQVMSTEPLVRQIGTPALRFMSWYQVLLVLAIIYTHALRGAGDTRSTMWINLVGIGLIRLPLAWLFGLKFGWGLMGAWGGMTLDVTCRAGILWWRYSRGEWVRLKV